MKFAICNETYQGWPLEKAFAHIAECGYDGVEIAPFTLCDDPRNLTEQCANNIEKLATAVGLQVVGLHWLLVKPEGLHLTTPEIAVRDATIQFAQHLVRLCAVMGGKIMVWGSGQHRSFAVGQRYKDAFNRAADSLRQVAETAGPLGVTLAVEPLSSANTNFLTTAAETIRLIEEVDHPACQLQLDVCAMCSEEKEIGNIISESREYIAHFHANDANLRGPGFGDVDYSPIADALHAIQYDGYVSVEVFDYSPDPKTIAIESLDYLQRYLSNSAMPDYSAARPVKFADPNVR